MNTSHIKFILTIVGMSIGLVSFAFSTFETKESIKESVISRLDRIEAKLDRAIENR